MTFDDALLITGANGHVGHALLGRLALCAPGSRRVRALVRSERAADTLRALPERERPEIVVADYADAAGLAEAVKGCGAVAHLVGILKQTASARYADAHEGATRALVAAAAGVGRIVYLSIVGARPDSPNACLASKGRAEEILRAGPAPVTVLRVPMVLGPGELAAHALAARARAKWVPLVAGGASLEQPVDSADVVSALLAAVADAGRENVELDLGGPECLSQRQLVERAAALVGNRPRVLPLPSPLVHGLAYLFERLLANPPLTPAMLGVLEQDDRIDSEAACRRLGIQLTPLDTTLRRCLGVGETAP